MWNANRSISVLFVAAMLTLSACSEQQSATSEEPAIRAQNAKWLDAIAKKDADAIAAMYATDGEFMPPNAPKVTGRDAIKAAWQGMFQIPGVGLTFTTDKFVFSKSADLAVDIGSYDFKSESGGSSVNDKGKSVVTWVKRDGTWLVLTDMFSSDAPALPSSPTPAPAAATEPPVSTTTPVAPVDPAATTPLVPGTPGTTTTTTTTPATPTAPPATTTTTTPTPAPATPPAQ
jgi:uncharacterized protein (TIGR02246 family)